MGQFCIMRLRTKERRRGTEGEREIEREREELKIEQMADKQSSLHNRGFYVTEELQPCCPLHHEAQAFRGQIF